MEAATDVDLKRFVESVKGKYGPSRHLTLVHCPTFGFDAFNLKVVRNRGYYLYAPTGLQCLKASLQNMDIKVDILDLNYLLLERLFSQEATTGAELEKLLIQLLEEYFQANPAAKNGVIGVSAGVTVSNIFTSKSHPFVCVLKHLQTKGNNVVMAGGVIATNEAHNLLALDLCHFLLTGEAEMSLRAILEGLFQEQGLAAAAGIHFKNDGKLYETQGGCEGVRFQGDLIPTYADVPIEKYHRFGSLSPFSRMIGLEKKYATVQLNRGCRGSCSFCGVTPFMGRGVRHYPTESVIAEMKYLIEERKIEHLEWLDDDLLYHKEPLKEILNYLKGCNPRVTWAANNGLIASSITEDLMQLMAESGCVGFRIGIESGNSEMLKKIRKPATLGKLRAASTLFKKFPEVFTVGCYIIGFDHETNGQILDTFKFALEMDLAWSGFSICQNIAETDLTDGLGLRKEEEKTTNFVPTKENSKGTLEDTSAAFGIWEILALPLQDVHSRDHLNEMWFAFNLISNYVNNKNLRRGGNPAQFIRWTETLQQTHPENAIIAFFLGLAHISVNDWVSAKRWLKVTTDILAESEYWQGRFDQYKLQELVLNPPLDAAEVSDRLADLMNAYGLTSPLQSPCEEGYSERV